MYFLSRYYSDASHFIPRHASATRAGAGNSHSPDAYRFPHPEVLGAKRRASKGEAEAPGACILRGSLRSRLRMRTINKRHHSRGASTFPLPPFASANGGEGSGVGGSLTRRARSGEVGVRSKNARRATSKCPPPLTPPRHALRAWAGGEIDSRSRDAFFDSHPSYEHASPKTSPHSRPLSDDFGSGGPEPSRSGAARKPRTKERKGSRTPKGASLSSALARRGARPAGRARLPAFHCGSCQGDCSSPRRNPGQSFLGLAGACEPMDRQPGQVSHASPRALPAPSCHRPASTSRTGHSAGRLMPGPPERGSDKPPPAGTAPRSAGRSHPAGVLSVSEVRLYLVRRVGRLQEIRVRRAIPLI